jgi:hypothetical protein
MDSLFNELVAVDSNKALNFFVSGLRSIERTARFRADDLLYVATILAHYSQTSRCEVNGMPVLADLSEVFDYFVCPSCLAPLNEAETLATGGAQVLLFAGFFRNQMRRRHNVKWYDQVGQALYDKASRYTTDNPKKRELFDRVAEHFPVWALACRDLHAYFDESRYLLKPGQD